MTRLYPMLHNRISFNLGISIIIYITDYNNQE